MLSAGLIGCLMIHQHKNYQLHRFSSKENEHDGDSRIQWLSFGIANVALDTKRSPERTSRSLVGKTAEQLHDSRKTPQCLQTIQRKLPQSLPTVQKDFLTSHA
jgi:hypothetical protein